MFIVNRSGLSKVMFTHFHEIKINKFVHNDIFFSRIYINMKQYVVFS